jgi:hypothetical protein
LDWLKLTGITHIVNVAHGKELMFYMPDENALKGTFLRRHFPSISF